MHTATQNAQMQLPNYHTTAATSILYHIAKMGGGGGTK